MILRTGILLTIVNSTERSLRTYNVIDVILFEFFFQGQFNFDLFASLTQGFRKLNAT